MSSIITRAAIAWLAVGLTFGLMYRTILQITGFHGVTRLAFLHTHALALGFILGLVLLLLDAHFDLSGTRLFRVGYWHYQASLAVTLAGLLARGFLDVFVPTPSKALDYSVSGISGLGHIGLTIGLVMIGIVLLRQVAAKSVS